MWCVIGTLQAFLRMAIVVPCCRDIHFDLQLGSIYDASLFDIWHNDRMVKLRLAHIRGDLSDYPLCGNVSSA